MKNLIQPNVSLWMVLVLSLLSNNVPIFSQESSSETDYQRAQFFLNPNESKVYEAFVNPNWIENENVFWYKKQGIQKKEYFLVDPDSKTKSPLFDREKLAEAILNLTQDTIDADNLPLVKLKYNHSSQRLNFHVGPRYFQFDIQSNQLDTLSSPLEPLPTEILSPNGKMIAYVKDYNLFVKTLGSEEEIPLTTDGEKHFAYASQTETNLGTVTALRSGFQFPPVLQWSPDSKRILTQQLDERNVKSTHLLQMVGTDESLRPQLYTYKYPVHGDSIIPVVHPVIIEVATKEMIRIDVPPMPSVVTSPLADGNKRVWWKDSTAIEMLWQDRNMQSMEYLFIDPLKGRIASLIKETDKTLATPNVNIFAKPNITVLNSGEFIWFSERTGYGHLYLHEWDTSLKNAITSGNYVVKDLIWADEENRQIYFTASEKESGRNPYFTHFYRVDYDGKNLTLLTPENADNKINLSPNHQYFIVNEAWNGLPRSILKNIKGELVMELETSDFSAWMDKGWQIPEQVELLADDGQTKIAGMIFRPSDFDENKKYPILDDIYPGPQINRLNFIGLNSPIAGGLRHQTAIAELGFIVIHIDGRGTPFRSKAFFNDAYTQHGYSGGLVDHVSGIKQMAERYPYMDTSRIGIFGHSGGGFASTRAMLKFPDFYKVAVSSAGNHNNYGYISIWMDVYLNKEKGENFEPESNSDLVQNLKGKLLLMTGDLDDNVHHTLTINLVDALIKASKDFDFMLMPNTNHGSSARHPYFLKKRWDYFYKHLLGKEPPANFKLVPR